MTRRMTVVFVCAGLAGLLATGCSATTKSGSASAGGLSTAAAEAGPAGIGGGGTLDSNGAAGAGTAAGGGTSGGTAKTVADDALPGPSLIRTAQLTVAVRDVAAQDDRAGDIAVAAGGSVDDDRRATGTVPTATLTLRVPPAQLDHVLSSLSRLGHEDSRQLSTQNVTTDIADVASRVASAQQTIAALRVLYARAQKVADVIDIETQLAQREADLESLQARQRALAEQVAMATVTLTLRPLPVAASKHPHHTGFAAGAAAGWRAFGHSVRGLATALGVILPFAAVLVVIAAGVLIRRRRRPAPASEPSPGG